MTIILYLNEEWDVNSDGGCLRTHTKAPLYANKPEEDPVWGSASYYQDIAPVGGRMVVFLSRHLLHEVLPAYKTRFALTMWNLDSTFQQSKTSMTFQSIEIEYPEL